MPSMSSLVAHLLYKFAGNDGPGQMVEGQTFTIGKSVLFLLHVMVFIFFACNEYNNNKKLMATIWALQNRF